MHLIQDIRKLERATSRYSGLCVVVLMVCASLTAKNLLVHLTPNWNFNYIPWLAGFVTIEALVSQRYISRTSAINTKASVYRFTELILIFVLTRLVSLPWHTGLNLKQLFLSWTDNLVENFFDAQFLLSLVAGFLIWGVSLLFAQDLMDQEGDELAIEAANMEGLVSDRVAAQRKLVGRVFAMGVVLVFINSFLRQEMFPVFGQQSTQIQGAWHVVVFFVAGLVLLSLSQLSNRRLAWAWEHIPVKPDIPRKWISTSVIFLLLLGLIAFVIPTAYTNDFLPGFGNVLGTILSLIYGLALLLLTPIFYLFSWLMSLFGSNDANRPADPIQSPILNPPDISTPTVLPAWMETLKSIMIWVVLVGAVGYSVYIYLSQNKNLTVQLQRVRDRQWLVKAWRWLVSRFRRGWKRVPAMIVDGIRRHRGMRRRRGRAEWGSYLSLRRLNPRQRVIFYYLALLRRTGEVKLPRADWQTPHEYDRFLRNQIPEVEQELASMTDVFIEARYSQHPVTDGQIKTIRAAWDRIRRLLRNRIQAQAREKEV